MLPTKTSVENARAADAFLFRAFISYSHRDAKVAEWLHRAIETYRIPKPLIGRATATGPIGKKPGKVFRDRDELQVAADLSGKINEALEQTQFLIVLCSRASAASKWVNQEVINFKRMKGADRIIAVIVDGEPGASATPGREHDECFVPALRFKVSDDGALTNEPAEPIAADLREGKDTKARVRLKVVAGLLDVGLDELIRRDSQRRARILFNTALAMGCVTILLAALTIEAVRARNLAVAAQAEADRKRAEAEELIEFMVGDLRTKLEPVGRLDVLDSVGQKVLDHFSRLTPEEQDDEALARRGHALRILGAIAMNKGSLEEAQRHFAESRATADLLVKRTPDSAERLYEYGEAVMQIGALLYKQGDYDAARTAYTTALETAKQLNAKPNPRPEHHVQLASTWLGLGTISSDLLIADQALAALREAQATFERLATQDPQNPSYLRDIGGTFEWIAGTYYRTGDFAQAIAYRERQAAIYEKALAVDPANKTIKGELFSALRTLANINLNFGVDAKARTQAETALSVVTSLTDLDPGNADWKIEEARILLDLGDGYLEVRDIAKINQYLSRAEGIVRRLTAADPSVLKWQIDLIRADVMRARYHMAAGRNSEADRVLQNLQDRIGALTAAFPNEPGLRDRAALANMYRGVALKNMGRDIEATRMLERVLAAYPASAGQFEPQAATTRAMALYYLGRYAEADPLLRQVSETGFRRREFREALTTSAAHLRDRVATTHTP